MLYEEIKSEERECDGPSKSSSSSDLVDLQEL